VGVLADFKAFLTKADFIALAVAVVVGLATVALVNSVVTNLINPAIGAIAKTNFDDLGNVTINNSTFHLGALLGAVINFLIILVVVFFLFVYPYSLYQKRQQARQAAKPTTRECPECLSMVPIAAKRCSFCGQPLEPLPAPK